MGSDATKHPWWARSTGGNRGWALVLALVYTLLAVVHSALWLTGSDWFVGVLAIGFLLLAVWTWASFAYLSRRPAGGDRRGW